jgi:peptide-methionine (R)-S-oxide reductase
MVMYCRLFQNLSPQFLRKFVTQQYLMLKLSILIITISCLTSCHSQTKSKTDSMSEKKNPAYSRTDTNKVVMSEEEWKNVLPQDVYNIARQKGTERPWSSKFENFTEVGTYYCAACGNPLFKSDTKFESGCGWPSFYEPISKSSVIYTPDHTHGMNRTEVQCGRCKAHLGHVFDDGPPPTGLRYCINGVVLDFDKAKEAEKNYNKAEKDKQ